MKRYFQAITPTFEASNISTGRKKPSLEQENVEIHVDNIPAEPKEQCPLEQANVEIHVDNLPEEQRPLMQTNVEIQLNNLLAGPEERGALEQTHVEIDLENLPTDPGKRPSIWSYDAKDRYRVRCAYLAKGPCQPVHHDFKYTQDGNGRRRFIVAWFDQYPNWLEYSVAEDKAYCLCCYLFKPQSNKGGGDSFVGKGFNKWKKKSKLDTHVGSSNSSHNQARRKCEDLLNQNLNLSNSTLHRSAEGSAGQEKPVVGSTIMESDFGNLPIDPGERPSIWSYDAKDRDRVRRAYLSNGPFQPIHHDFMYTVDGNGRRRFIAAWFKKYPDWLEYSIVEDKAYCLYCYLFKPQSNQGGSDSFAGKGFNSWRRSDKLDAHVGLHNSCHNQARKKCEDLMNQKLTGSISTLFSGWTSKKEN